MSPPKAAVDSSLLQSWRPIRGPFQRWPRTTDIGLAMAVFILTLGMWYAPTMESELERPLPPVAFLLFLSGSAVLVMRRAQPDVVHAMVILASAVSMFAGYVEAPLAAMMVSLYSLGRYSASDVNSYIGMGAAIGLLAISRFVVGGAASGSGFGLLVAFVLWYVGRRLRVRGEYLRLLEERAAQLEREQLAEADKAVAEERTRIARELHDIVAHQVSLMTVQAGAAKTVAHKDPQSAVRAMGSVEVAGRQALNDLRHLLGVLRADTDNEGLGPQPGIRDIQNLVDEVEQTGRHVSFSLECDTVLPARVDLSVYRIVQEALTNVLKHAGAVASVDVIVRGNARGVSIEVTDDGSAQSRERGSGFGISGMRERAHLLGGWLEAGPKPGDGFSVTAYLPASGASI